MNEIWSFDYRNENTSNDVFCFSVNLIGFEFQPTDFFHVRLFHSFCPKITSNFHSAPLSSKISFHRKIESVICFSVIKISTPTNFMHLRSKLTLEIHQKIGSLDEKMSQNWLKTCAFSFFFPQKTTIFKEK